MWHDLETQAIYCPSVVNSDKLQLLVVDCGEASGTKEGRIAISGAYNMLKAQKVKRSERPFILDEENIRKLNEVIQTRIAEKSDDSKIFYVVKFDDGSFYNTESLDHVLGEENPTHRPISELRFVAGKREEFYISVTYSTLEGAPCKYDVRGPERDWVYLTSADIDDRIGKSRARGSLLYKRRLERYVALAAMLFMVFTLVLAFRVLFDRSSAPEIPIQDVDTLEKKVDALVKAFNNNNVSRNMPKLPMYLTLGSLFLMILVTFFGGSLLYPLRKLYPLGTFAIGDQLKAHQRRIRLRSNLFWAVLVSLTIALASGYLFSR